MSKAYFGTDGIRGRVGADPMTVDFALRLASAAARVLIPDGGSVLIGKDTRVSGYLFEAALEAGFVAAGVNVLLTGPLPTPVIAYMTRHMRCDLGVVISASHNPYEDNGIKFFDGEGLKLSDELEERVEGLVGLGTADAQLARAGTGATARQRAAALPGLLPAGPARRDATWTDSRSSWTAPMALPTRSPRGSWPTSMPRWCRSAAPRTAATSTTVADPRRPSCCS